MLQDSDFENFEANAKKLLVDKKRAETKRACRFNEIKSKILSNPVNDPELIRMVASRQGQPKNMVKKRYIEERKEEQREFSEQ